MVSETSVLGWVRTGEEVGNRGCQVMSVAAVSQREILSSCKYNERTSFGRRTKGYHEPHCREQYQMVLQTRGPMVS